MGPDFNNDGRVDGYDMEYLSGSRSGGSGGGGNMGCGEFFKIGCLFPAFLLFMLYAGIATCSAVFGA